MMGEMIEIEGMDQAERLPAYQARPAGAPTAAIIVIQEIFGVNPGIRAKVDAWAERGYLALAPELFWRFAPGVQLDPDRPADLDQAMGLLGWFDLDTAMRDVEACIRSARGAVDGGKVGLVGFCLGGRIAYLAATRTDIDASVGYYGGGIDKMVNEGHAIGRPLILHFGEADSHIPPSSIEAIRAGLAANPRVTIHSYEGVGHGFAAENGSRRIDDAALLADQRTESLFGEALA